MEGGEDGGENGVDIDRRRQIRIRTLNIAYVVF